MKFRYLLAIFNIVLLLCFLTVFLLPAFILDFSFMAEFWKKSWYIGGLFPVLLVAVNSVYFSNRKLLAKLEAEDWPGLAQHLETEIFTRKKASVRKVRLLTDSLILVNDFSTIKKLEAFVDEHKPSLYNRCATGFAAAALISSDYDFITRVSGKANAAGSGEREWLDLLSGVSLQVRKQYSEAGDILLPLSAASRDPVVAVLSGYICGVLLAPKLGGRSDSLTAAGKAAKQKIASHMDKKKWLRMIEESKSSMHVVILGRMLDEAGAWLYGA